MVGTRVRDRMKDQTMAEMTASAIGTNRKRATPEEKHRHEHDADTEQRDEAGTTICSAPSRIAA